MAGTFSMFFPPKELCATKKAKKEEQDGIESDCRLRTAMKLNNRRASTPSL